MELHPFKALRPPAAHAAQVLSPPYDVMSTAEAKAFVGDNAASFFHVIRPDVDLADGVDIHSDAAYATGADALKRLVSEGWMVRDEAPGIWLYRLTRGAHQQVGFVGCANVSDYKGGSIKRHELTRSDKEDDRTRHIDAADAHTGPVFLSCRASEALAAVQRDGTSGKPVVDITAADGVRHELWAVTGDTELAAIDEAFGPMDAFYIADGHHRAASAGRVADLRSAGGAGPWDRFLVVVFPDDQLEILDYNRVVNSLNGLSPDDFLAAVGESFEITSADTASPPARHQFGMYLQGQWRRLTLKAGVVDEADPVASLDVAVLQDLVLAPILGITEVRTDPRIDFVGGIRGTDTLGERVDALVAGGADAVAFAMYPTSMAELLAVADAQRIMPPKSTWFEPKLGSGLFVHPLWA